MGGNIPERPNRGRVGRVYSFPVTHARENAVDPPQPSPDDLDRGSVARVETAIGHTRPWVGGEAVDPPQPSPDDLGTPPVQDRLGTPTPESCGCCGATATRYGGHGGPLSSPCRAVLTGSVHAPPAGDMLPAGDPSAGPCARCGERCRRYGDSGDPLCPACRATDPAVREALTDRATAKETPE